MKLKKCLKLGLENNLNTIGECLDYITSNSFILFKSNMRNELFELESDLKKLYRIIDYKDDDSILEILRYLK